MCLIPKKNVSRLKRKTEVSQPHNLQAVLEQKSEILWHSVLPLDHSEQAVPCASFPAHAPRFTSNAKQGTKAATMQLEPIPATLVAFFKEHYWLNVVGKVFCSFQTLALPHPKLVHSLSEDTF